MSKRFEETFTKEDIWMEKMHKKGNTHHLVNREMQIKNITRHHYESDS